MEYLCPGCIFKKGLQTLLKSACLHLIANVTFPNLRLCKTSHTPIGSKGQLQIYVHIFFVLD